MLSMAADPATGLELVAVTESEGLLHWTADDREALVYGDGGAPVEMGYY